MPANGRWPYADPRWATIRQLVLARDGHACTICHRGSHHGTILDVDHILGWATHPHLAFDPTNLRTLCRLHHNQKTHGKPKIRSRSW
jgi:5-methylcytosine-specific restriction endonuclease McrA